MDYLYVCNTGSDYLSRVNLESFEETDRITLNNKLGKVGPHGLYCWKSDLITANSYSNSISRIDMVKGIEGNSYYIGMHCNDVGVFADEAYIACGESNNIVVFDLNLDKIVEEIPCGIFPHSIAIDKNTGTVAVANMGSDSVTLIGCSSRENIREIKVGPYPTKCVFSRDGKKLFVCESNLGSDATGTIAIISLPYCGVEARIPAGKGSVDICCLEQVCYVSNFSEGSLSVIYLQDMEQVKTINIGGMPRGIANKGRYLYIGDNYGNRLIRYDIYNERKKIIPIGGEPTGIIVI